MADPRPLREQLELVRAYWELIQPASVRAFDELSAQVAAEGEAPGLAAGEQAPDFTLPDAHGEPIRLDDLLAQRHVVLAFYRGGWCPYCDLQLRAYDRAIHEIEASGGCLVAVSPQTPDHSLSGVERNALRFHVLSDVGNLVARRYRLVFALPPDVTAIQAGNDVRLPEWNGAEAAEELPVPATFVIARGGRIELAHVNADYTRRLEPDAIVAALGRLPTEDRGGVSSALR